MDTCLPACHGAVPPNLGGRLEPAKADRSPILVVLMVVVTVVS